MPRSVEAYHKARIIAKQLIEAGLITEVNRTKVQGIIQIRLEE